MSKHKKLGLSTETPMLTVLKHNSKQLSYKLAKHQYLYRLVKHYFSSKVHNKIFTFWLFLPFTPFISLRCFFLRQQQHKNTVRNTMNKTKKKTGNPIANPSLH